LQFFIRNDYINDDNDDFEDWEGDYYYLNKKDYKGLLKYRLFNANKNKNDIYRQLDLAEAYILNKEYKTAITFLYSLHKKYPDIDSIQYYILDALFACGKNENDIQWINKPKILLLSDSTIEICYNFLKGKRKHRNICDIYFHLMSFGYLKFNEENLKDKLKEDNRFQYNNNSEQWHDYEFKLSRKK
jgi:hypothetical protein